MKSNVLKKKLRGREKLFGNEEKPRLSVFRSNKYIFAQLIDDKNMKTIIGASEKQIKTQGKTKIEKARELGKFLAGLALKKKIEKIVFDKSPYRYHGRIKAIADGLREGGLKF